MGLSKHIDCDLKLDDFTPLITNIEIQSRIKEIAEQINHDYEGQELTLIMIMKGAVCIASDLIQKITVPCTIEYMQASSYGQNGTQAGVLTLKGIENLDLEGKHILLVDDIFDTGATITKIKAELAQYNPTSIKSAVLLVKNKARAMQEIPEYIAFTIENQFVIGYGLDYKELYRGLPDIWVKKD
jgi:hypoxanthine phosphoribosyltransferase